MGGEQSLSHLRPTPQPKQTKQESAANMSASSFLSVMVDDEVLVKAAESDVVKVEGSAYAAGRSSTLITDHSPVSCAN